MRIRLRRNDSTTAQIHEVRLPQPVKLRNGMIELIVSSPQGGATLHLSQYEVDELVANLQRLRSGQ